MKMELRPDHTISIETDYLGRKNIAIEIANNLLAYTQVNKEGLALAITGKWGIGKSTLLKFIKQKLEERDDTNIKLISFNPWLFYRYPSIKEAFLIHIAISLNEPEQKTTNISKKINELVKAFRWLKYISTVAGNLQETLEDLSKSLSEQKNINDIKDEIEALLQKTNKKIFIFLDDIDRLSVDEITELFQTITLVANFSNTVYVAAFDRNIVANVIDKKFNGKGQDYLEKIFQVDYEIPQIPETKMEELFFSGIASVYEKNGIPFNSTFLRSIWHYRGLKDYFITIRDLNRYFNSLTFRLSSIILDINLTDFLALEAIRIFDFQSYERFYSYFRVNSRKRDLHESGLSEEQFNTLGTIASEVLNSLSEDGYYNVKDTNSKRLLDPAYFHRYFNLLRHENDISEKSLSDLITQPYLRTKILKEAHQYNRIENLLERLLDRSIHREYKDIEYSLISNLIDFFNQHGKLFEQYSNLVTDVLINLICGSKKTEFIEQFFQSFNRRTSHPNLIYIYFFHFIRLFINQGRSFSKDYTNFDAYYKRNYDFIEKQFLPIFKDFAELILRAESTDTYPFIKYLYLINYSQLFPDKYHHLFTKILEDKEYLFYMANQITVVNESNLNLVRYEWGLNRFIYPSALFLNFYNAIREIPPQSLNSYEKAIQNHLLEIDISKSPTIRFPKDNTTIQLF